MAWLWHPHGVDAYSSASMTQRPKYFFVFLSAVAVFAMDLSLGSEARGQIQNKADAKTLSLGVISEINRSAIRPSSIGNATSILRKKLRGRITQHSDLYRDQICKVFF